VQNYGTNQLINQRTDTSTLSYRYDDGRWRVEAGGSRSASQTQRRYFDQGFFQQFQTNLSAKPVRVSFIGIGGDRPQQILITDNNNAPVDYYDLSNFRVTTAGTNDVPINNRGSTSQAYANVRRSLDFMPVPTSLQVGAIDRWFMFDDDLHSNSYTYFGPGGTGAATTPVEQYASKNYKNLDNGYGFSGIDFMSPSAAYAAWKADPKLFGQTDAQQATSRNYNIDNNENFKEEVKAAYVQFDTRLFNRLRVLGGVRFEKTIDDGIGGLTDNDAVWQRNADGTYVRNAAGARVRKPEAGAAGSMAESLLIKKYRAQFTHREYDGYYPSIHLTYDVKENFLVRAAYAKTYGRPDLSNLIPRTVATRNDFDDGDTIPNGSYRGTLTIRNPNLKPWTADNYDLSAEYYTTSGGLITAGLFLKDLKDFFGTQSVVATPEVLSQLGIDPGYEGYNITTTFNSGNARITGGELNLRQDLRLLGSWGRMLTVFANGTKLNLSGNPGANFSSFVAKSANWGFTFAYRRASFTARWNYRGQAQNAPQAAYGPNGYEYVAPRTVLDLNGSFQLTKHFSLVASASNILNKPQVFLRYGDLTPVYARQYATQNFGAQLLLSVLEPHLKSSRRVRGPCPPRAFFISLARVSSRLVHRL
jgi:TonB-dependent receptor